MLLLGLHSGGANIFLPGRNNDESSYLKPETTQSNSGLRDASKSEDLDALAMFVKFVLRDAEAYDQADFRSGGTPSSWQRTSFNLSLVGECVLLWTVVLHGFLLCVQ